MKAVCSHSPNQNAGGSFSILQMFRTLNFPEKLHIQNKKSGTVLFSPFQVKNLLDILSNSSVGANVTLQEVGFSQPLPPSSFQRFLRARHIPGVVLSDHQASFQNRYYSGLPHGQRQWGRQRAAPAPARPLPGLCCPAHVEQQAGGSGGANVCHVIEQAQHNYSDNRKKSSFVQKMFPTAGWEPEVSKWQLSVPKPHLFFQKLDASFFFSFFSFFSYSFLFVMAESPRH